jgi:hypothetical protein
MKRVLLVDDDPVLVRICQQGLTKYDLDEETAADGLSGISSLHCGVLVSSGLGLRPHLRPKGRKLNSIHASKSNSLKSGSD